MKEIVVESQKEYDKISNQKELTQIIIKSSAINITKIPENCIILVKDSSNPTINCLDSSNPIINCWEQSTLVMRGTKKEVKLHQQAVMHYIDETKKNFDSVEAWLKYWEVKPKDGKVTMYKAIRPDLHDFYTGKVSYVEGTIVICPDWKEDWEDECGHGLHCSPHLFLTERYAESKHRHIKVEVDLKDIRLPVSFLMPGKIRVKKLKVLEVMKET